MDHIRNGLLAAIAILLFFVVVELDRMTQSLRALAAPARVATSQSAPISPETGKPETEAEHQTRMRREVDHAVRDLDAILKDSEGKSPTTVPARR